LNDCLLFVHGSEERSIAGFQPVNAARTQYGLLLHSRIEIFNEAIINFEKEDTAKICSLLSASYRVGNLFKFLLNPKNPDLVTAEKLKELVTIDNFWRNFSFTYGNESNIDAFFSAINLEQSWNMSHADKIIIDPNEKNVDFINALLGGINSTVLKAIDVFSKVCFGVIDGNKGNYFSHQICAKDIPHRRSAVKINFSFYDENSGIAKSGGHYCYTRIYYDRTKKNVGAQHKTIYGSVFHEFDHALHWVEGRDNRCSVSLSKIYGVDDEGVVKWSNDEEFLTILGLSCDSANEWFFDPLSCATFSISTPSGYEAGIRCFHVVPSGGKIGIATILKDVPIFINMNDSELLEKFMYNVTGLSGLERR
jgi:hypothetical protein